MGSCQSRRESVGLSVKSCELYVSVIVPGVPAGSGCIAVTVSEAGVPTVNTFTGPFVVSFHPQPPEPSTPFLPSGGASMQTAGVHWLQLSIATGDGDVGVDEGEAGVLVNTAVPTPPPNPIRATAEIARL